MGLSKHLDSNEKMIYFFRPSRRAYIHQYIFYFAVIAACVYFMIYFMDNMYFKIVFGIISLPAIYGVIKNEWIVISSRYALTNERIFYSKGIFTEDFRSFHYYSITDIALRQTLWDKIVNTGTLSINTGGTDYFEISFLKISDPIEVKRKMSDLTPNKGRAGNTGHVHESHQKKK
jgi:uncharacterized membrane protein YdbT with pleckstrin-like domain